jgi:two-component system LytT family response regulator
MSLRAVLVDDEPLARNRLRRLLAQEPDVAIIGECGNGAEAVACIRERQPDVVFLDLHMPQLNGLEVVRALPAGELPAIIFVTAHDQHAVEAFEVQAADYLLKPVTRARLREAVRRVRQRLEHHPGVRAAGAVAAAKPVEPRLTRFAVKDGNQTLFVKVNEVDYLEAAANYVVLCTPRGNHIVRDTLRNLEALLPPASFLRVSRSIIVNLDRIQAIRSAGRDDWQIVLLGGREFQMTRGLKEVQERLQYADVKA